jgi:hypothetical protein
VTASGSMEVGADGMAGTAATPTSIRVVEVGTVAVVVTGAAATDSRGANRAVPSSTSDASGVEAGASPRDRGEGLRERFGGSVDSIDGTSGEFFAAKAIAHVHCCQALTESVLRRPRRADVEGDFHPLGVCHSRSRT